MKYRNQLIIALIITSLAACGTSDSGVDSKAENKKSTEVPLTSLVTEVMTKERQDSMSIDNVLYDLMEGNSRFVNNELTQRDHQAQLKQLTQGQYPKAVVLSCIDSRVPVEEVFDQGVGDLFVVRVAGNIENDHNLASLEYSCKVSGSKVIIVLGHENCGAIKSTVKGVDMGNITELLTHIHQAIDMHKDYKGEKTVDNLDFLDLIIKDNVILTLADIRNQSPILKEMEDKGHLKMVGAYFDLDTGKITLL